MPEGLTPARGDWEYRVFNTASAATYAKGCLVALNTARDVVEFTSAMSSYLGIAMSHSTASLPAGKVVVAIPRPGCTAISDVTNSYAASALSIGEVCTIGKHGNLMSYISTRASVFSSVVEIAGPVDSASSRIKVAFVQLGATLYSVSSTSLG
jgi:hypothetical protein